MKKKYSRPMLTTEEYLLNQVVAGACADAGKEPVISQPAVQVGGTAHCREFKKNVWDSHPCSNTSHTWTISEAKIFADGSQNANGCTTDIYNKSDYDALFNGGSHISGGFDYVGGHYVLHASGGSNNHLITLDQIGYNVDNYFRS
jgi:hypothetical protein